MDADSRGGRREWELVIFAVGSQCSVSSGGIPVTLVSE